jgi:hypothetical protein
MQASEAAGSATAFRLWQAVDSSLADAFPAGWNQWKETK